MQVCVKLPSGPLIKYLQFCQVIADAVSPIDKNLEGIKCVWAKIYTVDAPPRGFGKGVPYFLDEADRQELATVLSKLPPLHYPMSEEEAASFMKAYVNLPDRPEWEPLLETKEGGRERKNKHRQVMSRHIEAIREEHKAGRLVPVDINYAPVETVQLGAHLTRKDAISYLKRHGLVYDDEETAKSPNQDTVTSKAANQTHDVDQMASSGRTKEGAKKISEAEKAEAVKLHAKLKAKREKCTKLVAGKYEVSESLVRRWVRENKEKKLTVENYFFIKKREK